MIREKFSQVFSSFRGWFRLPDGHRLFGPFQIAMLVLLALSMVATALNIPGAFMAVPFVPMGWLPVLALTLVLASWFGVRRIATVFGLILLVLLPLLQPVTLPLAAIATAATVVIIAGRRGALQSFRLLWIIAFAAVYVGVFLLSAHFLVPALHVATVFTWTYMPAIALFLIVCTLTIALRKRDTAGDAADTRTFPRKALSWTLRRGWLAVLWLAIPFTVYANHAEWLVTLQMRHALAPIELAEMPYTVQNRMVPRTTAEYWLQGDNESYKQDVESPHIQKAGENMFWQSPVHDKRWYGKLLGSVDRIIRVNADEIEQHAHYLDNSGFLFGNDSWVFQAAFKVRHPFSQMGEVSYYQNGDGSWSLLVSAVSKRPTWTGTMVPGLSGVMEITQYGLIHDYSVEQAVRKFPGAVFFPPELGARYAAAYGRWRHGWLRTKALQDDVLEISEDPSDKNNYNGQPYIQELEEYGLQELVALEPLGDKQWALVELLMFDAGTGQARTYVVPKGSGLKGPRIAIDNVRQSNPQIDWDHIDKVEARFAHTRESKVPYWLVSVVTDYSDNPRRSRVHAYVTSALVNSKNLESYEARTKKDVESVLSTPKTGD